MKVKFHYEKDEYNSYTGITACELDGYMGYSFCHTGEEKITDIVDNEDGTYTYRATFQSPDQFNKKIGRTIAEGRALKLKDKVEAGTDLETALTDLYSHKMKRKINEYMSNNMHIYQNNN